MTLEELDRAEDDPGKPECIRRSIPGLDSLWVRSVFSGSIQW
jgi:hypothetical protein